MFINVIIPIPSHPLKLKLSVNHHQKIVRTKEDLCAWDVIESAEDSSIKGDILNCLRCRLVCQMAI